MNISLTLAASLLLPIHTAISAQPPAPAAPSAVPATMPDEEIIRQYSIHLGIKTAHMLRNEGAMAATAYLADPSIVRQSALSHLREPLDSKKIKDEFEEIKALYMKALRHEETEQEKNFMQHNARRSGVVSLPIGIQYEVIPDPENNNRKLEEMNRYDQSTVSGRHLFGFTDESANLDDHLPNILIHSSSLQNMPKGGEYIFYIPVELLSPRDRRKLQDGVSVIVYTFRHTGKDGTSERSGNTPAYAEKIKRMPDDLRHRFFDIAGKRIALSIQQQWSEGSSQDTDPGLVKKIFYSHADKPGNIPSRPDDYETLFRQYDAIHFARQTERDRTFIRENAHKPGVIVLANGIQYTVEKDPDGRNAPLSQAKMTMRSNISGTRICIHGAMKDFARAGVDAVPGAEIGLEPAQPNIEEDGLPDMPDSIIDQIEPGRKWVFYIPVERLSENMRKSWGDQCPEYVVHTFETDGNAMPSTHQDADIEDDAPPVPVLEFDLLPKPEITADELARAETRFMQLNARTPNVTVLPNGVQYSYITDPDGHNGSIKHVSTMKPQPLSGDSLYTHIHLDRKSTREDGTVLYTHPLIEPYIDDLPEAKKWFFCIPASLHPPADVEWYAQRIGVRPNYILYTLEYKTKH